MLTKTNGKLIFLLPMVGPGGAFLIGPCNRPEVSLRSQAEEHLKELATEWSILEDRVKDFAKSPNPDMSKASDLTTIFLKTAIDHAHTQEEIEEEHVIQAHQVFEDALEEENQLASSPTLPLVADGTDSWMENCFRVATRLHEDGTLLQEPFYQYLHCEDSVPRSPNFKQNRRDQMQALHEKEVTAQEEENEAMRTLEELRKNEEILKETLIEFEALQEKQKEKLEDIERIKQLRRQKRKQVKLLNELA